MNGQLPPMAKIIKLTFVDENKIKCQSEANKLKEALEKKKYEHEVFAAPALIPRISRKYYWHVLIQGPNPRKLVKDLPENTLDGWRIDVDPVIAV